VANLWSGSSLPTYRDLKELGYSKDEIAIILFMASDFAGDDPRFVWEQVRRDAPNLKPKGGACG